MAIGRAEGIVSRPVPNRSFDAEPVIAYDACPQQRLIAFPSLREVGGSPFLSGKIMEEEHG